MDTKPKLTNRAERCVKGPKGKNTVSKLVVLQISLGASRNLKPFQRSILPASQPLLLKQVVLGTVTISGSCLLQPGNCCGPTFIRLWLSPGNNGFLHLPVLIKGSTLAAITQNQLRKEILNAISGFPLQRKARRRCPVFKSILYCLRDKSFIFGSKLQMVLEKSLKYFVSFYWKDGPVYSI